MRCLVNLVTSASSREAWRRGDNDEGTIMILVIFFAVIIAGLITVVVDVSTVFLAQRELQSVADGAAAAAAQRADLPTYYGGPVGANVPLDADAVNTFVNGYVTAPAHLPHECTAIPQVVTGVPDGQTVDVELTCTVPLPFVNLVSQLWSDGVTIHEFTQARSVVTPVG
jgi:Flp pilus assembly protein TadG